MDQCVIVPHRLHMCAKLDSTEVQKSTVTTGSKTIPASRAAPAGTVRIGGREVHWSEGVKFSETGSVFVDAATVLKSSSVQEQLQAVATVRARLTKP